MCQCGALIFDTLLYVAIASNMTPTQHTIQHKPRLQLHFNHFLFFSSFQYEFYINAIRSLLSFLQLQPSQLLIQDTNLRLVNFNFNILFFFINFCSIIIYAWDQSNQIYGSFVTSQNCRWLGWCYSLTSMTFFFVLQNIFSFGLLLINK